MKKPANYIDRKYGLLTVIDCIAESNGNNNGGLWLCKCKCGKTITLAGYKLYHRASCGCKAKKAARERGINNRSPQTVTWRIENAQYKREFKNEQKLSFEQWKKEVSKKCVYCGKIDTRNSTLKKSYNPVVPLTDEEKLLYQAQINEIAEINGKHLSCCKVCKSMRGKLTHKEFMSQIQRIKTIK